MTALIAQIACETGIPPQSLADCDDQMITEIIGYLRDRARAQNDRTRPQ